MQGGTAVRPVRSPAAPTRPVETRIALRWASRLARARPADVLSMDSGACRLPGAGLQTIPTWTLHRATPLTTDRPRFDGVVRWPQQDRARIGRVPATASAATGR
jgi:hypothetical protein